MRVLMTAIVTFVAVSIAHAQPFAVPRDQAQETVRTVLAAISNGSGLRCALHGEVSNGSVVPVSELIKFSSSVMTLKSPLPTYEFVLSRGSLSQTAVLVSLSKDSTSLISAVIITSEQIDIPTMTGDLNSQLVPVAVSDCK